MVKNTFELSITRVVVEATIVKMSLLNFDGTSFIAQHKFLERKEAVIPTITFSIRYKFGNCSWLL